MNNPFKVGDYVRLSNGKTKMIVIEIHHKLNRITASYRWDAFKNDAPFTYGSSNKTRLHTSFTLWDKEPINPTIKEPPPMPKLYEWKNDDDGMTFGHKIGINRNGLWVMDPMGGGAPKLIPKNEVEEVIPYTINLMALNSKHKHHFAIDVPNNLRVGDLIFTKSGTLHVVIELDTKQSNAEHLEYRRVAFADEIGRIHTSTGPSGSSKISESGLVDPIGSPFPPESLKEGDDS